MLGEVYQQPQFYVQSVVLRIDENDLDDIILYNALFARMQRHKRTIQRNRPTDRLTDKSTSFVNSQSVTDMQRILIIKHHNIFHAKFSTWAYDIVILSFISLIICIMFS